MKDAEMEHAKPLAPGTISRDKNRSLGWIPCIRYSRMVYRGGEMRWNKASEIVAWMPLPKPYTGQKRDEKERKNGRFCMFDNTNRRTDDNSQR